MLAAAVDQSHTRVHGKGRVQLPSPQLTPVLLLQALSQLPALSAGSVATKLQAVRQMYRQALTEPEHIGLLSTLASLGSQAAVL